MTHRYTWKFTFKFLLVLAVTCVGALVVLVNGVVLYAGNKAEQILERLEDPDTKTTILNVSTWAANEFEESPSPLRGYLPIFYHRWLPDFIRLPRGSLDIILMSGKCSELARALEFLFLDRPYRAKQHDIVSPKWGHSAISIHDGTSWIFMDPFLGFLFEENGRFISLERMQELAAAGVNLQSFAVELRQNTGKFVYQDIDRAFHARQGKRLDIRLDLPLDKGNLVLGRLNGEFNDVTSDGKEAALTGHLSYIGPRYERNFRFHFTSSSTAQGGFEIVFHLLDTPDPGNLPISNVEARIDGMKLIYRVTEPLKGLSLDYSEMNIGWYPVDMIEIRKL